MIIIIFSLLIALAILTVITELQIVENAKEIAKLKDSLNRLEKFIK
jgi:ABC-type antimicrobial peptide transport system permease subunit